MLRNLLLLAAGAAIIVLIVRQYTSRSGAGANSSAEQPMNKVTELVENTLHDHQGESGTFVQAFEAALAKESHNA